ncbi:MAG: sulfatase [Chitinophagaceae bacterium]|nr:sulfatase [Chitinophagaceae bacterium]MCW5928908.1 sulfatase [Chitinophagaceae bacterium]
MRYIIQASWLMYLLLPFWAVSQPGTSPNIILINMDDMGYGDTEPYGMYGIATPHFNRVAKEGMRFTNVYSAQPVCSASRAGLLTGCYPNRLGIHGALSPQASHALNPSETTIASMLKKKGYATAIFGKWHLGSRAPYLPLYYGFDTYYGIPYSNDMWPYGYDGKLVTDTTHRKSKHPFVPWYDGNKQVDTINSFVKQDQITATITRKSVSFINEKAKGKEPFFLYIAHPMPHVPLGASAAFKGKSNAGIFGDVIMELDWSVGEVLSALDKNGLAQNTLLMITSDNGPWRNFGTHAGSSGGFREGKGSTWEGGIRVPFLVRWPEIVEPGTVNSQLVSHIDVLATLAAITGAPMPNHTTDGISFLKILKDKTALSDREVFYYYYGNNRLEGVRYKQWKLVLPHPSRAYEKGIPGTGGVAGPTPEADPVELALYNLTHDPGERYDVKEQNPDILQKLLSLAEEARRDLGDALTNTEGTGIRKPATF